MRTLTTERLLKGFTVEGFPPAPSFARNPHPRDHFPEGEMKARVLRGQQSAVLLTAHPVIHVSLTVATVSSGNWEWDMVVYN